MDTDFGGCWAHRMVCLLFVVSLSSCIFMRCYFHSNTLSFLSSFHYTLFALFHTVSQSLLIFSSVFWNSLFFYLVCVCRFFSFVRSTLLITFECVISSDDSIKYLFYCMPRGLRIRSRYVYKQSWIHCRRYCGIIRTSWNKRKEKRRRKIDRKKCSSRNQFNRHTIHSQIC